MESEVTVSEIKESARKVGYSQEEGPSRNNVDMLKLSFGHRVARNPHLFSTEHVQTQYMQKVGCPMEMYKAWLKTQGTI